MNLVTITDGQAVTTTLAISEGTENEHASVIKLVRSYQADLEEFGRVGFEIAPFETAGGTQRREVAILNEQQSTLLLTYMRNSDIVRAFKKRLVKEFWQMAERLRGQPASDPMAVLSDPAAMRGLLLTYTEKVIALEEKVAEQAPKVEGFDRIATYSDGSFCIRDAAKNLQVQEKYLRQWLSEHDWIYRRPMGAGWLGYSDKLKAGLLEHKISTGTKPDGSSWTDTQVRVTAKGLAKLAIVLPPTGGFFPPAHDARPRPHA